MGLEPRLLRRGVSHLVMVYMKQGDKAGLVIVGKTTNKIQLLLWMNTAATKVMKPR